MSKLAMVGATALTLVLTVATPTFAAQFGGGGNWMPFGGGSRGAQESIGSVVPAAATVAHCKQRWAYYDEASGRYMGDDGEWHLCQ
jgi:hypothetical protein